MRKGAKEVRKAREKSRGFLEAPILNLSVVANMRTSGSSPESHQASQLEMVQVFQF